MRALILRRVGLIEAGAGGPIADRRDRHPASVLRLQNFLQRNGQPHHVVDPAEDEPTDRAARAVRRRPRTTCWSVCPDGTVLLNPTEDALGRRLGMIDTASTTSSSTSPSSAPGRRVSPPPCTRRRKACAWSCSTAARSAARPAPARASRTISAFRPASPARRWPAAPSSRRRSSAPRCSFRRRRQRSTARTGRERWHGACTSPTAGGCAARTVVIASGARYRRPALPRLAEFEGHGVWYWASALEAKMCARQEVVLVGGGNSAGQAAVFLSPHARQGAHADPRRPGSRPACRAT